ncbi:hypothetical protein Sjap_003949 [Stephania japonica]|uniref:MYB-CC type transcription factor LHEQLE-containing domain-containing protein n=1 Tax=Stephania japonica TaxID=461633 RepID=A0AAP0KRG7_9MAGN
MFHSKTVPGSSLVRSSSFAKGQQIENSASTMGTSGGGNNLNNSSLASRQRLRWTHELHERFVDAVAQLGGPERKETDKKKSAELSSLEGSTSTQAANGGSKAASRTTGGKFLSTIMQPAMWLGKGQLSWKLAPKPAKQEKFQLSWKLTHSLPPTSPPTKEGLNVQRQLQLRIEAQGKYLKKIIEEQQRLSGVLSQTPDSEIPAPNSGEDCTESKDKTDPSKPAPTSESLLQERAAKECAPGKSLSLEDSFSSHHEPPTPESSCRAGSPAGGSKQGRLVENQRVSTGSTHAKPEMLLSHQILESSSGAGFR